MGKHKQKTHASTGAMWFTASGKYCGWIPAAGAVGCSAVTDDKETASLSQLVACCVCIQHAHILLAHLLSHLVVNLA